MSVTWGGTEVLWGGTPATWAGVLPPPRRTVWSFVLAEADGTQTAVLTAARSRRVTWRRRGAAEASFTIDGRDEQAAYITELATDLLCYRDGVLLFRGRLGPSQDQLSPDVHTVTVTVPDYRGWLHRQGLDENTVLTGAPVGQPLRQTAVEQELIGWRLIEAVQAQTGGNVGITRQGTATGVTRDRDYEAGKNVGEALDQLSEVENGFDWEIGPDLVYRTWYPNRGGDKGFVLDYGGTVKGGSRSFNPSTYATAGRVSGSEETAAVNWATADLATRPEGRWWRQSGYPDITRNSTLTARANWEREEYSTRQYAWHVDLTSGVWQPGDLWLGDTAQLAVRSGRLDTVENRIVEEIAVGIDDNGVEEVAVSL